MCGFGILLHRSNILHLRQKGILPSPHPLLLYAVSDEVHQYFVPERACRVFDIFVDTCGAMTGIGIFLLFIFIISKIVKKKEL
ncbi:MAG: VanZ family protein [Clostridia bacterium]|nr:VanZ family protein [Clostridia bacterium]